MNLNLVTSVALALLSAIPIAWAGRPLATDDAGTAEVNTCQIESWVKRPGPGRELVFAPACGIAEGMELGGDYTRPHQQDTLHDAAGLAFKWVPEAWQTDAPAGKLNFGVKLSTSFEHPAGVGWRGAQTGVLALATLKPNDAWTVHANLGAARQRSGGTTATLLNLALVWTPRADVLLFAETQANNRRDVFGGTLNTVGTRWWLVKDSFGLDLTASREVGAGTGTLWTVGFGWYGLAF